MTTTTLRRPGDPPRWLGYGLALAVFALDQLVKYWITYIVRLQDAGYIDVAPVMNLIWVENRGVSLSLFNGGGELGRWGVTAVTAAISAVVAVWLWRARSRWDICALGLVLGGALGNILDRLRFGYVVDFIHVFAGGFDFRYVFNAADAAISTGVTLLLLRALVRRDDDDRVLGGRPA